MRTYIERRAKSLAVYIIRTGATVRDAALVFGISKSTVHKDVSERLKIISIPMYESVQEILDLNMSERHIRGGEATKNKYLSEKK